MRDLSPLDPAWYCVRSQPKHEHIAAANLRLQENIEVFNPRLRVPDARAIRQGWIHQPLFPGYLFARFPLQQGLDLVRYTSGVKCLVHFGTNIVSVPDQVIEELREAMGFEEDVEVTPEYRVGDEVEIVGGPFMGLIAVVRRHMPAAQRVQVLLEVLGRATPVDLLASQVTGARHYPAPLLSGGAPE